jgi:hypothetical protein
MRTAETGEPYAAARPAVVNEHQGEPQSPFPGTGYVLRMSGEIHDWPVVSATLTRERPGAWRRPSPR